VNLPTPEGMPSGRGADGRRAAWLGVDVGGTNVRAACLDESGQLHGWVSYRHRMAAGEFHCIEDAVARSLVAAGISWPMVSGVGVAIAGLVDSASGTVLDSANLGWRNLALKADLERRLPVPVTIENDVCASALAELNVGTVDRACPWLYVSIGTGIGACLVLDAIEGRFLCLDVGHIAFSADVSVTAPKSCRCGRYGCLETVASGAALTAEAAARISGSEGHPLYSRVGAITGAEVLDLAMKGDRVCIEVLAVAGQACGHAVANLVNLLTPAGVGLSGGMISAASPYLAGVQKAARAEVKPWLRELCTFDIATQGEKAGVIGVAALARRRLATSRAVVGPG
jgi:glucokinase